MSSIPSRPPPSSRPDPRSPSSPGGTRVTLGERLNTYRREGLGGVVREWFRDAFDPTPRR